MNKDIEQRVARLREDPNRAELKALVQRLSQREEFAAVLAMIDDKRSACMERGNKDALMSNHGLAAGRLGQYAMADEIRAHFIAFATVPEDSE